MYHLHVGTKSTSVSAGEYYNLRAVPQYNLLKYPAFAHLKQSMQLDYLVLAHQVHGINSVVVSKQNPQTLISFEYDADILLTNHIGIGVGVLTADCVPIVLYDPTYHAVAIVHAGWRGSVAGVVCKAVHALIKTYGTNACDIHVVFGPSARPCCYQVDEMFYKIITTQYSYATACFMQRNNNLSFDIIAFNKLCLDELSVTHFDSSYSDCTICCDAYHSYRVDKAQSGRNLTAVSLR